MKKCHSAKDVASVQSQALVETIKEARQNEKHRQKLLMKASNVKRVNELKARFEHERARDQERIAHLMSDLGQVAEAANSGRMDMTGRHSCHSQPIPGKEKDRFALSQYHTVYQSQYNKMLEQARHAEWKNRERYDEYAEKRRVCALYV